MNAQYGLLEDPLFWPLPSPVRRVLGTSGLAGLLLAAILMLLFVVPIAALWNMYLVLHVAGRIAWRELSALFASPPK